MTINKKPTQELHLQQYQPFNLNVNVSGVTMPWNALLLRRCHFKYTPNYCSSPADQLPRWGQRYSQLLLCPKEHKFNGTTQSVLQ